MSPVLHDRRGFLKLTAASLAASQPLAAASSSVRKRPAFAWPEGAACNGFVLAVQAYCFNEVPVFQAVENAARAGASGIELWDGQALSHEDPTRLGDLNDTQVEALRAHLQANRLVTAGIFATVPSDEQGARKIFSLAKRLGAYGITTESIEAIDVMEKLVKELDLRVAFHGHRKGSDPNYRLWDPEFVKGLVEKRDPRVGACVDIGHHASTGLDPLESIRILKGRNLSVHVKDRAIIGSVSPDVACGTGKLKIVGIMDFLKKTGFDGYLTVEFENHWGKNVPDIAQYIGYMRGVSATLGD